MIQTPIQFPTFRYEFILSRLKKKEISEKILRDCYGHTVIDGEMVFTGKYLQKIR